MEASGTSTGADVAAAVLFQTRAEVSCLALAASILGGHTARIQLI